MRRARLDSGLPSQSKELQALLNVPNHRKHGVFRNELALLYEKSKADRIATLASDLERVVRGLVGS